MPQVNSIESLVNYAQKTGVNLKIKDRKTYIWRETYSRGLRTIGLPFYKDDNFQRIDLKRVIFSKSSDKKITNFLNRFGAKKIDVAELNFGDLILKIHSFKAKKLKNNRIAKFRNIGEWVE